MTTAAVPQEQVRRALAALVDRPVAAATGTVPVPGGVFVVTADYPSSHEHNKALLTGPADARQVLEAVERAATDAALDHVRLDVITPGASDEPTELTELAVASGYERSRQLVMVLPAGSAPPPPHEAALVRELPWEQVRERVRAGWEQDLPAAPGRVHDELADRRHATARAVELRHLAALLEGSPVARADLYLGRDADGPVAQIESVVTDSEARGRGLARALVTTAVRLALGRGATLVFLVADADDWPREFYARLGFVPVATQPVLTQAPRRGPEPTPDASP